MVMNTRSLHPAEATSDTRVRTLVSCSLNAVQTWHVDIHQDQFGEQRRRILKRLTAIVPFTTFRSISHIFSPAGVTPPFFMRAMPTGITSFVPASGPAVLEDLGRVFPHVARQVFASPFLSPFLG